jgi:hypothetical protein
LWSLGCAFSPMAFAQRIHQYIKYCFSLYFIAQYNLFL